MTFKGVLYSVFLTFLELVYKYIYEVFELLNTINYTKTQLSINILQIDYMYLNMGMIFHSNFAMMQKKSMWAKRPRSSLCSFNHKLNFSYYLIKLHLSISRPFRCFWYSHLTEILQFFKLVALNVRHVFECEITIEKFIWE